MVSNKKNEIVINRTRRWPKKTGTYHLSIVTCLNLSLIRWQTFLRLVV